jgi:hypothetical protein
MQLSSPTYSFRGTSESLDGMSGFLRLCDGELYMIYTNAFLFDRETNRFNVRDPTCPLLSVFRLETGLED